MPLLFQTKYNAACLEREDIKEQKSKMQTEICDLKETLDRRVASNQIEVSLIMLNAFCSYALCEFLWICCKWLMFWIGMS